MKTSKNRQISRWGLLATAAIISLLILGSAIYAQNGPGFGRDRQGFGQGFGPGIGRGEGPGMGGPGMMQRGPEGMLGMQFLMQDEDIRHLMARIKFIEGINRLDLTVDQVEVMIRLAYDAQDIVNANFSDTRDQIHEGLEDQLHSVLAGNEVDPESIRLIMQEARERVNPEEIKLELSDILDQAVDILTDEQREQILTETGPGREEMRQRFQDGRGQRGPGQDGRGQRGPGQDGRGQGGPGQDGPGMGWLDALDDETRERVESQIRERMCERRENMANMKLMMMLLSPDAIEAMNLWLDYQ